MKVEVTSSRVRGRERERPEKRGVRESFRESNQSGVHRPGRHPPVWTKVNIGRYFGDACVTSYF
jgi:hypothetical protein